MLVTLTPEEVNQFPVTMDTSDSDVRGRRRTFQVFNCGYTAGVWNTETPSRRRLWGIVCEGFCGLISLENVGRR